MNRLTDPLFLTLLALPALVGCFDAETDSGVTEPTDTLLDMSGEWEVELEDAERCDFRFELEQEDDEIEGEALVECRIYFTLDGESYYYDIDERNADVEGEVEDDGDFELVVEFWDEVLGADLTFEFEGEVEDDEMEGDVTLDGSDWGDFAGELI